VDTFFVRIAGISRALVVVVTVGVIVAFSAKIVGFMDTTAFRITAVFGASISIITIDRLPNADLILADGLLCTLIAIITCRTIVCVFCATFTTISRTGRDHT